MSVYADKYATGEDLKPLIARLDVAFCNQFASDEERINFFGMLMSRMIDNGFTVQRAKDAVNWVIDHCRTYKQINIADVIQYDRTVECLTYEQMCARAPYCNGDIWQKYQRVQQGGEVFYKPKPKQ